MRPRRISFAPHAPDDDGICTAQQLGDAGVLALDGVDVAGGVARFAAAGDYARVGYKVGINSAGNLAGVNFTLVGKGQAGNSQTETLAGPNNETVQTSAYWSEVSAVSADAAVGTDVIVGTVDEAVTATFPLDLYTPSHTVAVDISGAINYTVQQAFERPTAGDTPNWHDIVVLSAQTADKHTTLTDAVGALRLVIHSFTGGATATLNIAPRRAS